jgi:RNA polymerase sigma-70 factor, ECF subfamily
MADDVRFEELYKYYPGVLALLRRLGFSADQARDIAQEAYVRVLKSMDDYRGESHWSYLEKVVRRVAMNEVRARHTAKRQGETVSDDALLTLADEQFPRPDQALETEEVVRRVRSAIAQLDTNDRTVLLLKLDGFSYEDMVTNLDISLPAVKSRLNVARKRLKQLLSEEPGSGRE